MGAGASGPSADERKPTYQDVTSELGELAAGLSEETSQLSAEDLTKLQTYLISVGPGTKTAEKFPEACDIHGGAIVTRICKALQEEDNELPLVLSIDVLRLVAAATTDPDVVLPIFNDGLFVDLLEGAVSRDAAGVVALQQLVYAAYAQHAPLRAGLRGVAEGILIDHNSDPDSVKFPLVAAALRLLRPLYAGLREPLDKKHVDGTILQVLSQCAKTNASGNLGVSPMEIFIDPLTDDIKILLAKVDPEHMSEAIASLFRAVLKVYDPTKPMRTANALHLLARLVDEVDGDSFREMHQHLLKVVSHACASEHTELALKGLSMWKQPSFIAVASRWEDTVLKEMAPAFTRHGNVHWNADVLLEIFVAMDALRGMSGSATVKLETEMVTALRTRERYDEYMAAMKAKRAEIETSRQNITAERTRRSNHRSRREAVSAATRPMNFVFGKDLGKGAFATVRYARYIEEGVDSALWHEFAVKQVSKILIAEQRCEVEVRREVEIHRDLSKKLDGDRGAAMMYHSFEDAQHIFIVQQYCGGGDVFDVALAGSNCVFGRFADWTKFILRETADVLRDLHKAGYFYGDLKPENILIRSDGHIALADFGASMKIDDAADADRFGGTADYLAPELVKAMLGLTEDTDPPLDPVAADWWAYGCLVHQLVTGKLPFTPKPAEPSPQAVLEAFHQHFASGEAAEPVHHREGHECPDVVKSLLTIDSSQRASYDVVVKDPFFAKAKSFSDTPPEAPPKLCAASTSKSRNTGRKESLMWRQVHVTAHSQTAGTEVTVDAASLVEENPDEEQVYPRGVIASRVGHKRRGSGPDIPEFDETDPLAQYMTVMPR